MWPILRTNPICRNGKLCSFLLFCLSFSWRICLRLQKPLVLLLADQFFSKTISHYVLTLCSILATTDKRFWGISSKDLFRKRVYVRIEYGQSMQQSECYSGLNNPHCGLEKIANFRKKIVISPLLLHLLRWSRKTPVTSSNQNNLHRLLSLPTGLQHFHNWSCFLNKNLSTKY